MLVNSPGILAGVSMLHLIQAAHPDWTHQQCLDEQERVALAAFARYADGVRKTTDALRE